MMEQFIFYLCKVFYFILPGVFANMAPIFVKNIFPKLAFPIDFGRQYRGKPIFGPHKTFRGFLFGILFAIVIILIQRMLYEISFFESLSILEYGSQNIILIGFFMGFGALFGDAIKSFVKRRVGIEPGKPFFPWDQIDAPLGALLFLFFILDLGWVLIVSIILIALILHLTVRTLGYYLKINKERW